MRFRIAHALGGARILPAQNTPAVVVTAVTAAPMQIRSGAISGSGGEALCSEPHGSCGMGGMKSGRVR